MQNKYLKFLIVVLALAVVVPQVAFAAWWNPMSWGWVNRVFHFQQTVQKQEQQVKKDGKLTNQNKVFTSKQECEKVTGCACTLLMCDYVPSGKTFEEVCGKDFKKGWQCKQKYTDQTSDWKTYTDTQYGFEMKYPKDFVVEKNLFSTNFSLIFCPPAFTEKKSDGSAGCKVKSVLRGDYEGGIYLFTYNNEDILNKESYQHLGHNALDNKFYYMFVHDSLSQYKDITDKIVSSFKFTTPVVGETAGWKTYKNTDWGIEFEYPSNFGEPKIENYTLSFKNSKLPKLFFLQRITLNDVNKNLEESIRCEKETTVMCDGSWTDVAYWQKLKGTLENSNIGNKVQCSTTRCDYCEIVKEKNIKMLIEHNCFNPGGPENRNYFYSNGAIFYFLPHTDTAEVQDVLLKDYNVAKKTILSTFKFTK